MVVLAQGSSGQRAQSPPQEKIATVMLALPTIANDPGADLQILGHILVTALEAGTRRSALPSAPPSATMRRAAACPRTRARSAVPRLHATRRARQELRPPFQSLLPRDLVALRCDHPLQFRHFLQQTNYQSLQLGRGQSIKIGDNGMPTQNQKSDARESAQAPPESICRAARGFASLTSTDPNPLIPQAQQGTSFF